MEYIKVNDTEYECKTITTGIDNISFTMENQNIEDVYDNFKNAKELTVSGEDKVVYGIYNNLSFSFITLTSDGTILVSMNTRTDIESRIENLENSQSLYGEAINELAGMIGGIRND